MSAYPPLLSVRDVPVHGWALLPTLEWACMAMTHGGRIDDVQYDWRCLHCVEAAEERIRQVGDTTMWWRYRPADERVVVTLSWLVARARFIDAEVEESLSRLGSGS